MRRLLAAAAIAAISITAAPAIASSGDVAAASRDQARAVRVSNDNRQRQFDVHAAKSCSSGWKRARINGSIKCLRVGQFCAHAYDHRAPHPYSYKHYGYACRKQDSRGNYHLTYRY